MFTKLLIILACCTPLAMATWWSIGDGQAATPRLNAATGSARPRIWTPERSAQVLASHMQLKSTTSDAATATPISPLASSFLLATLQTEDVLPATTREPAKTDPSRISTPTLPTAEPGIEIADIDEDLRFVPSTRPSVPEAQHPPAANEKNVDTNKPIAGWQRLTDDWFGIRPKLDDRGISFQASFTLDGSKNLRGGADTAGSAFRNLFNANVTLDTERLFGWKGGTFFANFQNQNGRSGQELTGSYQGISNIDADGRTQISELWYEQALLNHKLHIKFGKIDASSQFAHPSNADEFLNTGSGNSPTILGLPAYPDPAFGVQVRINPNDNCYLNLGLFDGSLRQGKSTGDLGPSTISADSLFTIAEGGVTWTIHNLDGRVAVGAWYHTGDIERINGGTQDGTWGPYIVLDQMLWRADAENKDDHRGIGMFFQYGYADPAVSAVEHHLGAGLTWTGPIPNRADDVLGLAASWVRFSNRSGAGFNEGSELDLELFYKIKITQWLSIKPNFQFIHNPGGLSANADAFVTGVRFVVDF